MAKIPEEVLLGMVANAGGGGGTTNYNDLSNQPQINGVTLSGDKSASDLSLASLDSNGKVPSSQLPSYVDDVVEGYYDASTDRFYEDSTFETVITPVEGKSWVDIPANKSYRWTGSVYVRVDEGVQIGETSDTAYAGNKGKANADAITAIKDGTDIDSFGDVETALANKQNTITAGTYIQKSGDTISVKRDVSEDVDEILTLTQDGYNLIATLSIDGTVIESETFTQAGGTFVDLIAIDFNVRAVRWHYTYLKASKNHGVGYDDYIYSSPYTDTFVVTIGKENKLIIKSELDDAMSTKQDTLTFDNVPTENSNNPVKSGGVKSAIDAAVASAYHHAGTKTCVELVAGLLVAGNEGNVYNMTDSGTTTADFIEGAGQPIKAGDNVGIAKINDGVYKFDLLSGFVDTSNFVQKSVTAGLLQNDGTVDTTIQGDVESLKSGLTTLDNEVNGDATVYPYADVITIPDAVPSNLADCTVKIEPVQDLHGYDKPWVGGAGKNIIPLTVSGIKSFNTSGTWTGNVYSVNGVTLELLTDSDNNVTGVKLNGSNNSGTAFDLIFYYGNMSNMVSIGGTYTVTGCTVTDGRTHEYSGTFTIDSDWYINAGFIKIYVGATKSFDNEIRYPQLEVGNQATTFAPYTNICPITGHTEASVQRDGKNLLPSDIVWHRNNQGGFDGSSYDVSDTRARTTPAFKFNHVGTFTLSGMPSAVTDIIDVYCFDSNKNLLGSGTYNGLTFTTLPNTEYIYILVGGTGFSDITFNSANYQIEKGQTATPYEPYQGKTYTIALGDTIYGGTVDFDSGVMTVTKAIVDLGSLTWTLYPRYSNMPPRFGVVISGIKNNSSCVCESYQNVPVSAITLDSDFVIFGSENYINIVNSNYDDATEFKTSVDGIHCVYELATPTTIQLTPQQIQLLKGQNTLTASTGQISVTVNGVSGSIGSVQEQANATDEALAELAADIAEQLPTAPTTDGAYVLTVTVASGTPTYSWESTE